MRSARSVIDPVPARLIPVGELTAADEDAWRQLAAAAVEPNPFYEPEFVLPAANHLPEARDLAILQTGEGGEWTACLPIGSGRWRAGIRAAAAWRSRYSFLSTPLIRAGAGLDAVGDLLDCARRLTGRRIFALEGFAHGGAFSEMLDAQLRDGPRLEAFALTSERALLRRRDDGEYTAGLRAHHQRELNRLGRRLAEQAGGPVEDLSVSADPDAVQRFLDLESTGWKRQSGTALASSPSDAGFFRAICERFREAGRLELLELRAGGAPVAAKCNLRSGEGSFAFKIGYDEAYAKFSPGVQLELANLRRFHLSGASWMDSCAEPGNTMINRLWPARRVLRTAVIAPAGPRGQALRSVFRLAYSGRERLRDGPPVPLDDSEP